MLSYEDRGKIQYAEHVRRRLHSTGEVARFAGFKITPAKVVPDEPIMEARPSIPTTGRWLTEPRRSAASGKSN
jgi:hypothetical protein